MRTEIGKIKNIYLGIGGYQDCMIGVHVSLGSDKGCWGVWDSRCEWDANLIKVNERTQWSEDSRDKNYADIMRFISDLLHKAKVNKIDDLKGKPIEATFDGNLLKSWRILEEVL